MLGRKLALSQRVCKVITERAKEWKEISTVTMQQGKEEVLIDIR